MSAACKVGRAWLLEKARVNSMVTTSAETFYAKRVVTFLYESAHTFIDGEKYNLLDTVTSAEECTTRSEPVAVVAAGHHLSCRTVVATEAARRLGHKSPRQLQFVVADAALVALRRTAGRSARSHTGCWTQDWDRMEKPRDSRTAMAKWANEC